MKLIKFYIQKIIIKLKSQIFVMYIFISLTNLNSVIQSTIIQLNNHENHVTLLSIFKSASILNIYLKPENKITFISN